MAEKAEQRTTFMTGGPVGLGDPDDKALRRIEKEVLIPKIVRERAKTEKCLKYKEEWDKCVLAAGPLLVVECRRQNTEFKACVHEWFTNPDFYNECKQIYLDKRSEFRRTGEKTKRPRPGAKQPESPADPSATSSSSTPSTSS